MKLAPIAFVLLGALGAAAGCAVQHEESDTDESEIREMERRALGPARAYPAETISAADEKKYASSKKARRELGWHILAKALQPVTIAADQEVRAEGAPPRPVNPRTIPLFRTWLGGDEFRRMFAEMYGKLGKERRQNGPVPSNGELDAIFDWNATSLGPSSEADYFARLAQISNQRWVDGLGGNDRVSYSPGYIRHYLKDYSAIDACKPKLTTFNVDTPPTSPSNFTNCFSSEFDTDAAVIKASWRRNDDFVDDGLPVLDTSAAAVGAIVRGEEEGAWKKVQTLPLVKAGPKEAYSVTLSDESGFSLVGLHIMTKELRHWTWVTVWWSPNADEDFGQDRPEEIKRLGAPWDHYKMCVVTDYDEKDPDPRGGFTGSLGDALAATHQKTTWCSNGFIEKGPHNGQTNCIGCHQHAGDVRSLDKILVDDRTYPLAGTSQVRQGFPADYSWALATPDSPQTRDRLIDIVTNQVAAWKTEDAKNH